VLGAEASRKRAVVIPDLYGDAAWDADVADPPRLKYVIAAMRRSGSNLMVRQLYRSEIGLPAEYFHPRLTAPLLARWGFEGRDDVAYVKQLLRSRCSRDLIWGCKLHWEHLNALSDQTLDRIFDGAKVILTRRRDLAKQALSLAQAVRSGKYDPRWPASPERDPSLRAEDVDTLLGIAENLILEEQAWLEFVQARGLPVCTVWYEDYLSDHDEAHRRIFEFLEVERPVPRREPPPRGKTGQSKQDSETLKRLQERIHELLG
jgi:LPS sulfotransferase NodH